MGEYKIHVVADKLNLPKTAIRHICEQFKEEITLQRKNTHRLYNDEAVKLIDFALKMRNEKYSVSQIRDMLRKYQSMNDKSMTSEEMIEFFSEVSYGTTPTPDSQTSSPSTHIPPAVFKKVKDMIFSIDQTLGLLSPISS